MECMEFVVQMVFRDTFSVVLHEIRSPPSFLRSNLLYPFVHCLLYPSVQDKCLMLLVVIYCILFCSSEL